MNSFSAQLVADCFVSLSSLFGLLLFSRVLQRQEPHTELTRKFSLAIWVLFALMAARLLQWTTDLTWAGRLTYLIAGFVPLTALLVVESLLRAHAPQVLKFWVSIGGITLAGIALFASVDTAPYAILALAAFQILSFVALTVLVSFRDKSKLSAAENQVINRLALSFLLILPFLITDFRTDGLDFPVRLSGVAILVLIWLALTVDWRTDGPKYSLNIFVYALCIAAASFAIQAIARLNFAATIQASAILISVGLLAAIFKRTSSKQARDREGNLLSILAHGPMDDLQGFLNTFEASSSDGEAIVLEEPNLVDFDTAFFSYIQSELMVTATQMARITNPQVQEQFSWFFKKFEASHALLISSSPFRLLVLNVPELAQSKRLEDELRILQRMVAVIAERESANG